MALIKKCNICFNKGMFLKLENGLCPDCYENLRELENRYTRLLQKLTTKSDNIDELISELSNIISDAQKFDGYSSNLNINECQVLLNKLDNEKNSNNIPSKHTTEDFPDNKKLSVSNSTNINLKLNSPLPNAEHNTLENNNNIKLNFSNLNNNATDIYSEEITQNNIQKNDLVKPNENKPKIRGLIEPYNPADELTAINPEPSSRTITFGNISMENTENQAPTLKDGLLISNLKNDASKIVKILQNPSMSLNIIAKNYFELKNEIQPKLSKYSITEIDGTAINTILEDTKNTLCLRCKKQESELFSFFNYVSIFLQTTGTSPLKCDIIEVSALKISYGEIIDEFYSLVNPIKSIKLSITNNTGISNEDVANAPTIDILLPSLLKFIDNYTLVAFNHLLVETYLNHLLTNLKQPLLKKTVISVVNLYRIRFKNYYGSAARYFDIVTCCKDLLTDEELNKVNAFPNISTSYSHAIYILYEVLKYRYK